MAPLRLLRVPMAPLQWPPLALQWELRRRCLWTGQCAEPPGHASVAEPEKGHAAASGSRLRKAQKCNTGAQTCNKMESTLQQNTVIQSRRSADIVNSQSTLGAVYVQQNYQFELQQSQSRHNSRDVLSHTQHTQLHRAVVPNLSVGIAYCYSQKTVAGAGHPAAEMPLRSSSGKKHHRRNAAEKQQCFSAAFQRHGIMWAHKNAPMGAMVPVGTALVTTGIGHQYVWGTTLPGAGMKGKQWSRRPTQPSTSTLIPTTEVRPKYYSSQDTRPGIGNLWHTAHRRLLGGSSAAVVAVAIQRQLLGAAKLVEPPLAEASLLKEHLVTDNIFKRFQ
ncbi:hypothetical protein UY3_13154 [Chelonia mydas]|uniref:Uncharacterized protein n=1 Tax=Chelonia mydas TaxID=8469 RepID=M7AYH2_CHEMY|nr:hypothetical protein UY3_13154 [Chelonia mydas]